jgi:hypothetical protein
VFVEFIENEEFPASRIGQKHRVIIVAPDADENLKRIVAWLRSYGVPIEFVPFSVFADPQGLPRLLSISGVQSTSESNLDSLKWRGHWIFNTNEKHGRGAYRRMFERNVAAIYGYPTGPATLQQGAAPGDKVLAYVSGHGVAAVGDVVSGEVKPGTGIFLWPDGTQKPEEYHLDVIWTTILPLEKAIHASFASALDKDYTFPARVVFGRLKNGPVAERLVEEITQRSQTTS